MDHTRETETLTPDEFAARYAPAPTAQERDAEAPFEDYYILNRETGKLELHFAKATYQALDEAKRTDIKSNFLWGRYSGCWISRCKEPNLHSARRCAESLGLADAGKAGERLSYAEQMERKAARAERRADRYDEHAEAAERRGEALQKPINDMHGDIAFFTQPNINTSAGRAFTRKRERMWQSFERGFEEFHKSEYWQGRAASARATADQKGMRDKGFIMRRIKERESDIRKLKKSVEEYEGYIRDKQEGRTPRDRYGWEIKSTAEQLQEQIDIWLERLEAKLDELGYYQDALDALGGVAFGRASLKKGDLLIISRYREPVRFLRGGPQNFTFEFTLPHMKYANGEPMQGQAAYAEIIRRADEPGKE